MLAWLCIAQPVGAQTVLTCEGKVVTVDLAQGEIPSNGDDVIRGTSGDDTIDGLAGNDTICGLGGDDTIDGNDGFDRIFAGAGNDVVAGGVGNDRIVGGPGLDLISGGPGNDRIWGGADDDELRGDGGYDRLFGMGGHDLLRGGSHDDELNGNVGRDRLFGDGGNDVLRGGAWRDTLDGGAGSNDGCTLTDPGGLIETRLGCETGVLNASVVPPLTVWDALIRSGRADSFRLAAEPLGFGEFLRATTQNDGSPIERTVFAPSDSAFAMLDPSTRALLDNDPAAATALLGYHVVDVSLSTADLFALDGNLIATITGLPLGVDVVDGEVILNGAIRLVPAEIEGLNGTVHIIDTVLTPPTVNPVIGPPRLLFEANSAELIAPTLAELRKAIDFFAENEAAGATIEGHTSTAGDAADNLALSQLRAEVVKQFLVDNGIEASRFVTVGRGESQPILVDGVEDVVGSNRVEFLIG